MVLHDPQFMARQLALNVEKTAAPGWSNPYQFEECESYRPLRQDEVSRLVAQDRRTNDRREHFRDTPDRRFHECPLCDGSGQFHALPCSWCLPWLAAS
jgi:hypothetical protein